MPGDRLCACGAQAQIGMSCCITSAELDLNISPPHPGNPGTVEGVGGWWGEGAKQSPGLHQRQWRESSPAGEDF